MCNYTSNIFLAIVMKNLPFLIALLSAKIRHMPDCGKNLSMPVESQYFSLHPSIEILAVAMHG